LCCLRWIELLHEYLQGWLPLLVGVYRKTTPPARALADSIMNSDGA
jgi:hypothetical protein